MMPADTDQSTSESLVGSINHSVISGLRWVTFCRLLAQTLTWLNTLIVIRLLSPTDFGLAALAGVFANFLLLLNELGLSTTLIRWQIRDRETLQYVFGALLLVGSVFMISLIIASPIIGYIAKEPRVVPLIEFISIQFVTMAFAVIPQARLSIDMRFRDLSITDLAASLVGAATTLVLALRGSGPWSLAIGVVALTTTRAMLLNCFCFSLFRPRFQFSKLSHLASFSGLAVLEKTLWYWYMQIDNFVVGRSLGAAELGIYGVGRQVASLPLERVMGIINSITLPTFSRVQHDLDQVRKGYLKLLRLGAAYAFPVFWGIGVISDPLVRFVFGTKWLGAVPVMQILCISMPLRMLNSFTGTAVVAINRQDVNISSLLQAIVVMPVSVLIGSRWGVLGVATAWAIGFPIVYLFNAFLVRRALEIHLRQMISAIVPAVIPAAVMVFATLYFSKLLGSSVPPLGQILLTIPFGAAVFLATVTLTAKKTAQEMLELARALASRRN
jgi:teichuronic acid exporter